MKIDGKEWKLVPVAATDKMVAAGWSAPPDDRGRWDTERERNHVLFGPAYRAMLAAAPSLDIEVLVEGVAWSLLGSLKEMSFKGAGDHWHSEMQYAARAVLRHLFGDEK